MEPSRSTLAKDAFFYLLQFVTLATSAVALGNVWFSLIDHWTPSAQPYESYTAHTITGGLSALVIAGPAFLFLSWWIRRSFFHQSIDSTRALRKWLIYVTLFATAIISLTDLIAILNTYLDGEFTLRFFLKALTILVIAGSIFLFYFWDVRRETPEQSHTTRWALALAILVFITTTVSGFWVVGSPTTRRMIQWDYQRVNDLRAIARDLHYRAFDKERPQSLPEDAAALATTYSYLRLHDPGTGEPYQYRKRHETSFELCTTFSLPAENGSRRSKGAPYAYPYPLEPRAYLPLDFRTLEDHGAGRQCFDFRLPDVMERKGGMTL